jgi:EAL domain-containing protein (putative c-di-GMP-specific phosphodiesterase class I)
MMKESILESPQAPYPVHPFHILEQNSVASFFEPLFSVPKMGVIGLETLHRAVHPDNQSLINPRDLFRGMGREEAGLKLALDRLMRQKGLEGFSPFQTRSPHLFLVLGVEPSILRGTTVGSGHLHSQVQKLGLAPRQIVIAISLSGEMDLPSVGRFMEMQRRSGFLLSLRDVSTRAEHLEAIHRFKPDMIRAEDSLIRGLAAKPENKRAFRRISNLAHSLGILVTAGGLDSEEDALAALELGADILQGRYFYHNHKAQTILTLGRKARMQFLADRYRRRLARRASGDRDLMNRCKGTASAVFAWLDHSPAGEPGRAFTSIFRQFPALECLFLLDGDGLQAGEAVLEEHLIPERKRLLFQPTPKGTDHSLREYFYGLADGRENHLTAPYLSMKSGNLCVTASRMKADGQGGAMVLCADLNLSKV